MILDSHIHTALFDGTPQENQTKLLADMKKVGIDGGVIISLDPRSYPDMNYVQRLDHVLALCEGQDLLFPFFWIDPLEENAVEQVDYAVSRGIQGFKMICTDYYPSDPRCLAVCRRAAELDKPVTFHSGILWDGRESAKYNRPGEFECLLEIPHLRFVLAHVSWPWCEENLAVYGKFENAHVLRPDLSCEMFVDTTPGTPRNRRKPVFEMVFEGDYEMKYNTLFGTDCSTDAYNLSWVREWRKRDVEILRECGMDDDFLDHYYCKNLLRYLGKSDEKICKQPVEMADHSLQDE